MYRASRSVPGAPEPDDDGGGRAPTPDFVDDDSLMVGFLDLPDVDADDVLEAILDGFSRLDDAAVLTAYCTDVNVDVMVDRCGDYGVVLVHSVPHERGTTFVLQRSNH